MTAQTATHDAHSDGHEEHVHHYNYPRIWAILVVLLLVSIAGPELPIPHSLTMAGVSVKTTVVLFTAFGIAIIKAWMVMKYFMHIDVQSPVVHYFVATALVFMVLFFAGTSPDVMKHEGTRWENVSAKAATERALAEAAEGGGHHGGGHGEGEAQPAPEPGHH